MKKLLLIALVFIIFILFFLISQPDKNLPSVTIDNKTFAVDVAKTPAEQEVGLAKYDYLPNDKAMVFPFSGPDYYTFWMKNMKFPIDIIYIRNGKIVDIFSDVPAPKSPTAPLPVYKPKALSDTVLEINAGLSKQYNFKIGDNITLNY